MIFEFICYTIQSSQDLGTALEKAFPTDFFCLSPGSKETTLLPNLRNAEITRKNTRQLHHVKVLCCSSSQTASNCFGLFDTVSHILKWVPTYLHVFPIPCYCWHLLPCFTLHPDIVQVCSNAILGTNSIGQALKNRLAFRSEMSSFRFARRMPSSCTGLASGVSHKARKACNQTSGYVVSKHSMNGGKFARYFLKTAKFRPKRRYSGISRSSRNPNASLTGSSSSLSVLLPPVIFSSLFISVL